MKTCPKCYRSAEKYYYFGMSFFWRCTNQKCSVLDVEDPSTVKQGYVEPEVEEKTEPQKKEIKTVEEDDFIDLDNGFPSFFFINEVNDLCENMGLDVLSVTRCPYGKLYIDLSEEPTQEENDKIKDFCVKRGMVRSDVSFRKRSRY